LITSAKRLLQQYLPAADIAFVVSSNYARRHDATSSRKALASFKSSVSKPSVN
jgi:hypothetical protein